MEYNIVVSESETQHINFTSIGRKRVRLVSTNFYVESYQAYEAGLRKNYHGFDPPGCGGRIASSTSLALVGSALDRFLQISMWNHTRPTKLVCAKTIMVLTPQAVVGG
jgi:hypothetical protein